MSKRNALDALRAVYERGERCQECAYCDHVNVIERLSGRATERHSERVCTLLDAGIADDTDCFDCPGVEDETNKENERG